MIINKTLLHQHQPPRSYAMIVYFENGIPVGGRQRVPPLGTGCAR